MKYIIYDLEATCWRGRPPGGVNEIIEIGAYALNRYGQVISIYEAFVKPTINPILSTFCKQLTSISQEQIDRAKLFPAAIEEFKDWINIEEEQYMLCSWGMFDKQIIHNNCEVHKLDHSWLDSHLNVKDAYHERRGMSPHKGLKAIVKLEGFEFTGIHHRAISDAENLAKVFAKYIDEWPQ